MPFWGPHSTTIHQRQPNSGTLSQVPHVGLFGNAIVNAIWKLLLFHSTKLQQSYGIVLKFTTILNGKCSTMKLKAEGFPLIKLYFGSDSTLYRFTEIGILLAPSSSIFYDLLQPTPGFHVRFLNFSSPIGN